MPNLYQLEVRLKSGNTVVHTVHQRFGFRTIELRPGLGMLINGNRVFLKGTDRHSFWPDSGRTLSEQISRDDINVMKDLNANAVRSSHYPPDRHFLDACDELGLYVLDELTGWQAHYDTDIGHKLVKEMVEHDVNHPSILFWDNGNEGGFNFDLDDDYAKYDPQKRIVLHRGRPILLASPIPNITQSINCCNKSLPPIPSSSRLKCCTAFMTTAAPGQGCRTTGKPFLEQGRCRRIRLGLPDEDIKRTVKAAFLTPSTTQSENSGRPSS